MSKILNNGWECKTRQFVQFCDLTAGWTVRYSSGPEKGKWIEGASPLELGAGSLNYGINFGSEYIAKKSKWETGKSFTDLFCISDNKLTVAAESHAEGSSSCESPVLYHGIVQGDSLDPAIITTGVDEV